MKAKSSVAKIRWLLLCLAAAVIIAALPMNPITASADSVVNKILTILEAFRVF